MVDKKRLGDLAQLARADWMVRSTAFAALKQRDEKLLKKIEDLSLPPKNAEMAQRILGYDRISNQWQITEKKKLNLERAKIRAEMAILEPQLRTSVGKKNVLEKLMTHQKRPRYPV